MNSISMHLVTVYPSGTVERQITECAMGNNTRARYCATHRTISMCIVSIRIVCTQRACCIGVLGNMKLRDVVSTVDSNRDFTSVSITSGIGYSVLNAICF